MTGDVKDGCTYFDLLFTLFICNFSNKECKNKCVSENMMDYENGSMVERKIEGLSVLVRKKDILKTSASFWTLSKKGGGASTQIQKLWGTLTLFYLLLK